tara:strand:+ start:2650 stop:2853 length:204 start_codon:yes stop_codon:yes gene_type:complete
MMHARGRRGADIAPGDRLDARFWCVNVKTQAKTAPIRRYFETLSGVFIDEALDSLGLPRYPPWHLRR